MAGMISNSLNMRSKLDTLQTVVNRRNNCMGTVPVALVSQWIESISLFQLMFRYIYQNQQSMHPIDELSFHQQLLKTFSNILHLDCEERNKS